MGKGTGNATRVHALRVLSLTAAQSNLCKRIKGKQGLALAVTSSGGWAGTKRLYKYFAILMRTPANANFPAHLLRLGCATEGILILIMAVLMLRKCSSHIGTEQAPRFRLYFIKLQLSL